MAGVGPQHTNNFPENAFPTAGDVPLGANVLPIPRSPPSPRRHPVLVQPYHHTGAPQTVIRQHDGYPEDIPSPIQGNAAHGRPQDLQYIDMAYYDMAHPPIPPGDQVAPYELRDHGINDYVGVPQAGPARAQAIALPAPIEIYEHVDWYAEAGPDRAIHAELPQQGRMPDDPTAEVLRQLANRYLHQPGSQVGMIHMERGPAGGIRVVITLELADI